MKCTCGHDLEFIHEDISTHRYFYRCTSCNKNHVFDKKEPYQAKNPYGNAFTKKTHFEGTSEVNTHQCSTCKAYVDIKTMFNTDFPGYLDCKECHDKPIRVLVKFETQKPL